MFGRNAKKCKNCVNYKTKEDKNPHPKYSYNSGLITLEGKPVWGIDSDWLMYEIKCGNGLRNTNSKRDDLIMHRIKHGNGLC